MVALITSHDVIFCIVSLGLSTQCKIISLCLNRMIIEWGVYQHPTPPCTAVGICLHWFYNVLKTYRYERGKSSQLCYLAAMKIELFSKFV